MADENRRKSILYLQSSIFYSLSSIFTIYPVAPIFVLSLGFKL